jgi:hypothetical protein
LARGGRVLHGKRPRILRAQVLARQRNPVRTPRPGDAGYASRTAC